MKHHEGCKIQIAANGLIAALGGVIHDNTAKRVVSYWLRGKPWPALENLRKLAPDGQRTARAYLQKLKPIELPEKPEEQPKEAPLLPKKTASKKTEASSS